MYKHFFLSIALSFMSFSAIKSQFVSPIKNYADCKYTIGDSTKNNIKDSVRLHLQNIIDSDFFNKKILKPKIY